MSTLRQPSKDCARLDTILVKARRLLMADKALAFIASGQVCSQGSTQTPLKMRTAEALGGCGSDKISNEVKRS
jgi:hypothetical protein